MLWTVLVLTLKRCRSFGLPARAVLAAYVAVTAVWLAAGALGVPRETLATATTVLNTLFTAALLLLPPRGPAAATAQVFA